MNTSIKYIGFFTDGGKRSTYIHWYEKHVENKYVFVPHAEERYNNPIYKSQKYG